VKVGTPLALIGAVGETAAGSPRQAARPRPPRPQSPGVASAGPAGCRLSPPGWPPSTVSILARCRPAAGGQVTRGDVEQFVAAHRRRYASAPGSAAASAHLAPRGRLAAEQGVDLGRGTRRDGGSPRGTGGAAAARAAAGNPVAPAQRRARGLFRRAGRGGPGPQRAGGYAHARGHRRHMHRKQTSPHVTTVHEVT
jgi:pyruvate/2-oxoglutarate dehydrogenase complex dihydrolipoamide acyltransferase (E2) component